MASVLLSRLVKADMGEIGEYIRRELKSPSAAAGQLQRFRTAVAGLGEFPESGAPLLPPGKAGCQYRFIVCVNYLVFYHTNRDTVMVDRVLYGRRDHMALLFGDALGDEEIS